MLQDLYLVSCYFDTVQAVLYEDDLNRRYGDGAVTEAIRQGLLERRKIPCAAGRERIICWLSEKGRVSFQ